MEERLVLLIKKVLRGNLPVSWVGTVLVSTFAAGNLTEEALTTFTDKLEMADRIRTHISFITGRRFVDFFTPHEEDALKRKRVSYLLASPLPENDIRAAICKELIELARRWFDDEDLTYIRGALGAD